MREDSSQPSLTCPFPTTSVAAALLSENAQRELPNDQESFGQSFARAQSTTAQRSHSTIPELGDEFDAAIRSGITNRLNYVSHLAGEEARRQITQRNQAAEHQYPIQQQHVRVNANSQRSRLPIASSPPIYVSPSPQPSASSPVSSGGSPRDTARFRGTLPPRPLLPQQRSETDLPRQRNNTLSISERLRTMPSMASMASNEPVMDTFSSLSAITEDYDPGFDERRRERARREPSPIWSDV